MKRVRCLSDAGNVTISNRTLAKDEEADCPDDRAKFLLARGLIEFVEPDAAAERAMAERLSAARLVPGGRVETTAGRVPQPQRAPEATRIPEQQQSRPRGQ